jgi:hypothetical protein
MIRVLEVVCIVIVALMLAFEEVWLNQIGLGIFWQIAITAISLFAFPTILVFMAFREIAFKNWKINIPYAINVIINSFILKQNLIILVDERGNKRLSCLYEDTLESDRLWCSFQIGRSRAEYIEIFSTGAVDLTYQTYYLRMVRWYYFNPELELERKITYGSL